MCHVIMRVSSKQNNNQLITMRWEFEQLTGPRNAAEYGEKALPVNVAGAVACPAETGDTNRNTTTFFIPVPVQ